MPYDDTDVKKMIKYQTERKVGFSRHKKLSTEVKDLIHGILEANTDRRFTISHILASVWMIPADNDDTPSSTTTTTTGNTRPAAVTTTAGSREHEVLPAIGEQSGSTGRAANVETDRLATDSVRRPTTISANNNNDTGARLARVTTPSVSQNPGAGLMVVQHHRYVSGGVHRPADGGTQAVPRSLRRREDPVQTTLATSPVCPAAYRLRACGR